MHRYARDDVTRSYHQCHHGEPMVNVKVYDGLRDGFEKFAKDEPDIDPGFTLDWIEENVSDESLDATFWFAAESEWEYAQGYAEEIFDGYRVKLHAAGRSGGWAVLEGLPDVDEWDAILLAKWHKFERYARASADWHMARVIESVYINEYEWQLAEDAERERAANQDIATRG